MNSIIRKITTLAILSFVLFSNNGVLAQHHLGLSYGFYNQKAFINEGFNTATSNLFNQMGVSYHYGISKEKFFNKFLIELNMGNRVFSYYNLEDNIDYRFKETVMGIPVIAFMDIFHTDTQQFHLGLGGVFSFAMNQKVFTNAIDEVELAFTNTESLAYINAGIAIGFEYNVLVIDNAGLNIGLWTFYDLKNPIMDKGNGLSPNFINTGLKVGWFTKF